MKILLAVLLSLPAWGDPRNPKPDWIDGASIQYSRERYLTGVGVASERAAAEDKARAEIARVFSAQVAYDSKVAESEESLKGDGKAGAKSSQQLSSSVATTTRKVLAGVEIVETWEDKAAGKHHALAALDRAKAAASVKERIAEIDKGLSLWKAELDKGGERLHRVHCAMKILGLFRNRRELNEDLRVLDPKGRGASSPPIEEAAVRPQASKVLSELDIVVALEGKGAERVETGIVKGLSSLGLTARAAKEGKADIRIDGVVESEALDGDSGWRWSQSMAAVRLRDAKDDKVFLSFDATERQASASAREALRRSLDKLGSKVAAQVADGIGAYFERQ